MARHHARAFALLVIMLLAAVSCGVAGVRASAFLEPLALADASGDPDPGVEPKSAVSAFFGEQVDAIHRQRDQFFSSGAQPDFDASLQLDLLETRLALGSIALQDAGQTPSIFRYMSTTLGTANSKVASQLSVMGLAAIFGPLDSAKLDRLDPLLALAVGGGLAQRLAARRIGLSRSQTLIAPRPGRGLSLKLDESVTRLGLRFDPSGRAGVTIGETRDPNHALELRLGVADLTRALKPRVEAALNAQVGADHIGLSASVADNHPDPDHHLVDIVTTATVDRIIASVHARELDGSNGMVTSDDVTVSDSWALKTSGQLTAGVSANRTTDTTRPQPVNRESLGVTAGAVTVLADRFNLAANATAGLSTACATPVASASVDLLDRYNAISAVLRASYDEKAGRHSLDLTVSGAIGNPDEREFADNLVDRIPNEVSELEVLENELNGLPGERLVASGDPDAMRLRALVRDARAELRRNLADLAKLAPKYAFIAEARRNAAEELGHHLAHALETTAAAQRAWAESEDRERASVRGSVEQGRASLGWILEDLEAAGIEGSSINKSLITKARELAPLAGT